MQIPNMILVREAHELGSEHDNIQINLAHLIKYLQLILIYEYFYFAV